MSENNKIATVRDLLDINDNTYSELTIKSYFGDNENKCPTYKQIDSVSIGSQKIFGFNNFSNYDEQQLVKKSDVFLIENSEPEVYDYIITVNSKVVSSSLGTPSIPQGGYNVYLYDPLVSFNLPSLSLGEFLKKDSFTTYLSSSYFNLPSLMWVKNFSSTGGANYSIKVTVSQNGNTYTKTFDNSSSGDMVINIAPSDNKISDITITFEFIAFG